MPLSYILAISCLLTLVLMTVVVVSILIVMRFGQEWVSNIVERFMNPDKNKKDEGSQRREQPSVAPQQQVASSQALRQRAQSLDFPAPATGFTSQAAAPQPNYQTDNFGQQTGGYAQPARASLRSREQYPSFNPQAQQPSQTSGFQPTMPSLSASRPFQGGQGLAPAQPQYPQQGGFPQQPGLQPQPGFQQQGLPPAQPQYPAQTPQQGGLQPLRPQQGGFPQQPGLQPQPGFQQQGLPPAQPQYPAQTPQQGGLQPLRPQQGGFPQQPGLQPQPGFQQQGLPPAQPQYPPQPQQGYPQAPQQGGLGDYRPQLNSLPRPDERTQAPRSLRRDNRRQDDYAEDGGIEGLIDGATDFLDKF